MLSSVSAPLWLYHHHVHLHCFFTLYAGGGLAGLTLAARLSEDKDKTVCVLEAGGANLNDPMIGKVYLQSACFIDLQPSFSPHCRIRLSVRQ